MSVQMGGATIPADATSLVGRRRELTELKRLLAAARLVTLTGTGGVGKTRLALQVSREVARAFDGKVFWVPLAEVAEPAQVVLTVMEAVGQRTGPGDTRALTEYLGEERLLLVLDNCEHLTEACADLAAEVLQACPDVRVLATSREVLDIAGEHVFAVTPLPVPEENATGSAAITRADAVALFVDRATAAAPDFRMTPANENAVAALCRHLDGLPLAIELAAVRMRGLSAEELLRRQDERLEFLTRRRGGASTASRHQSLRATVDWSFELCTPEERHVWARLSVFSGGCTLDAAEDVCTDQRLPRAAVLDALTGLIEKSVLTREEPHGRVRYRMLETIRRYGHERLSLAGEESTLRRRHRDHYLRQAEHVRDRWFGPGQAALFAATRREHANLRAALEYSLTEPGESREALHIASALWMYWIVCGLAHEGAIWLERALAGTAQASPQRADALWTAALLGNYSGRPSKSAAYETLSMAQECHRLAATLHDPARLAHATYLWGYVQLAGNDPVRGFLTLAEGVEMERACGDSHPHLHHAQILLTTAASLANLDNVVRCVGEECRDACRDHGEQWLQSWALLLLGLSAVLRDASADVDLPSHLETQSYLKEAIRLKYPFREPLGVGCALDYLAWSAVMSGDPGRGARLFGASTAFLLPLGLDFDSFPTEGWTRRGIRLEIIKAAKAAMGEQEYRAAYLSGSRLTPDEAVAYALDDQLGDEGRTTTPEQSPVVQHFTRRERQVATLLAEGASNREIAERLVISPRTAETHVANILAKLDCTSRTQAAILITEMDRASGAVGQDGAPHPTG
ncbi:LuxR C-terminal-related transcriptional regulator [Streptomyces sp. BE20]|uniref:ATP-binding protein n=1 Tax=Streptomyces sp. BE20 TaxID=3002525 RepID=UPI002E7A2259|nr:LuxR C-terminal-related transcriptional regulator [Streptomyces sp. BE20]MEE1820857.1 LuxR C-terminal-related transcriptional regulator [Streptomyces sp. BE20]